MNDASIALLLARIDTRLAAIENKLATPVDPPAPGPDRQPSGLALFVRSPDTDQSPPYGFGAPMREVDAKEAIKRACANVNWRGDIALEPAERDAMWVLVERLKIPDPEIIEYYSHLDPAFCGLGLLTGLFAPHTSDARSFGATKSVRESFAGKTIEQFLEEQFSVGGAPGIA